MTLPVVFTANGPSGYNLTKSLRFRSSASAYLNRTPSVQGSLTTWTWSAWVKLGDVSTASRNYFMCRPSGGKYTAIYITNNILYLDFYDGSQLGLVKSANVLRDPSAWYHIVVVFDTTNATASNRIRQYINGVQVTAFNTSPVYPSQNATGVINTTGQHNISSDPTYGGSFIDGEVAELNFVDGQALTPSSFGSTNALTGVWQPAKYTGTYGTNGFYLPFTNTTSTSTLGNDFSGNGNTWTVNNISLTAGTTYDSMNDVPTLTSATTANYCVMNPLNSYSTITVNDGNLQITPTTANYRKSVATMAFPSSGTYYLEGTLTGGTDYASFGIVTPTAPLDDAVGNTATGYGVITSSTQWDKKNNGTTSGNFWNVSTAAPLTLQIAINTGTGNLWIGYNNTWLDSSGGFTGNPSAGTNATFAIDTTRTYLPSFGGYKSNSIVINLNFGQRAFTYTPPTGYVALNTYNLPTSTIVKGNTVMDATLYTGTLVSNPITNTAGFKPDLVWIKSRSAATDNKLTDSVRGTTKALISNTSGAETTDTQGLTAFGTGGFTVGTNTDYNNLAATYVGWQWQAGQGTTSSNTSGSITSTVSVNASAGFSVVTYTGNGSTGTVGHGLGVAPSMYIVKRLSGSPYDWYTYHVSLGNTQFIRLNTTGASATFNLWQNTTPTSSVFYLANDTGVNASSTNYVAYCWSEIAGFSKFGSYTGNGSTDGTFVYLGFRPKYILMKKSSSTEDWAILDTSRSPYNVTTADLYADLAIAEETGNARADLLSNGIKFRTGGGQWNLNGATYIYMAFAENPFKNALAR